MTRNQAIKKIVDNFNQLLREQGRIYSCPEKEAIWFHTTDHAGSYEVDEEWLGVTANGKIAWAYASGCSCWDGDFSEDVCDDISMKEFTFNHEDMKAEWEAELIKFAEAIEA